jgi:hypothetical protein
MKEPIELVSFHCIREDNEWEGESWYHYFLDEPEVFDVLMSLTERENSDFSDLETVLITWDEATRLTNQDHGTYMQANWFGKLTNLEGLKNASDKELYKGGIRDFGEELFE